MRFSCAIHLKSESADHYLFHKIIEADTAEEAREKLHAEIKADLGEEYDYCHTKNYSVIYLGGK